MGGISNKEIRNMIKIRIFGLILALLSAGMVWYNWQELHKHGSYYLKIAAFGPVGVVGGLFLIGFPGFSGVPKTTREKVIVFVVFGLGLLAGLVNTYLMDPGMFGGSR